MISNENKQERIKIKRYLGRTLPKASLKTWFETAKNSNWNSPNDIKETYINASILKDRRVVFNIKGNSYRLIVKFNYVKQWAFIRFIGTHAEHNKIDADTV